MPSTYCLKCKKQTPSINAIEILSKSGKHMQQSNCEICNTKRNRFAKKTNEIVDNILVDEII